LCIIFSGNYRCSGLKRCRKLTKELTMARGKRDFPISVIRRGKFDAQAF